jgi:2-polyprenyl-3-methyl-5-hydroxy-6-metoxy-1,4-benzoquinol methylase
MLILSRLQYREKHPELMDQPALDTVLHRTALRGLARINHISASDSILWRPIERLAYQNPRRTLRVLDIGTGGGDVLLRLCRRARRANLGIEIAGADRSETAVEYARLQARRERARVEFFQLDVLKNSLPSGFDVIFCSLFLHHLETLEAIELMRRMAHAAGTMMLINDLVRSRLGYLLACIGTRVLSRSPIVHVDGPLSVRAAFTIDEVRQLAAQAGLQGIKLSWQWPFRFLLEWQRHA